MQWEELELERLAASRAARSASKEQQALERQFEAYYRQENPKGGPLVLCKFVLQLTKKRASIKWRDWLLKLAGSDAVKEAEASAGEVEKFSITPPI